MYRGFAPSASFAAPGDPILQYNFNWDKMSAVAGLTFYNFYFRLYKGSIKSAEVVEFLGALLRHLPGPLTRSYGIGCLRTRARSRGALFIRIAHGCASNTCRVMPLRSTRSSTSGHTGSSTPCPMFARRTSGRSMRRRAKR